MDVSFGQDSEDMDSDETKGRPGSHEDNEIGFGPGLSNEMSQLPKYRPHMSALSAQLASREESFNERHERQHSQDSNNCVQELALGDGLLLDVDQQIEDLIKCRDPNCDLLELLSETNPVNDQILNQIIGNDNMVPNAVENQELEGQSNDLPEIQLKDTEECSSLNQSSVQGINGRENLIINIDMQQTAENGSGSDPQTDPTSDEWCNAIFQLAQSLNCPINCLLNGIYPLRSHTCDTIWCLTDHRIRFNLILSEIRKQLENEVRNTQFSRSSQSVDTLPREASPDMESQELVPTERAPISVAESVLNCVTETCPANNRLPSATNEIGHLPSSSEVAHNDVLQENNEPMEQSNILQTNELGNQSISNFQYIIVRRIRILAPQTHVVHSVGTSAQRAKPGKRGRTSLKERGLTEEEIKERRREQNKTAQQKRRDLKKKNRQ